MDGSTTTFACAPEDRLRLPAARHACALDVAQLVHDLRTPLNGILGIVQLLMADAQDPLPPRHLRRLAVLRDAGDDMLAIVEDVLDASRDLHHRAQRRPLPCAPVDVAAVVRAALALIEPRAAAAGITLDCSLPATLPAQGHARAIGRVVLNLLANAVLHNRPQGRISLTADTDRAGNVELRIADTGPGMDAAQLRRACRPYQRGDAAQRGVPGTGLGLSSCRALMQALGGALEIASAPGAGTTATLRLRVPAEPH